MQVFNSLFLRRCLSITKLGILGGALIVSCESLAQPQESQSVEEKHCRYLSKVEGASGYGKNTNWQSLAKAAALKRAESIGASHVVWEQLRPVGAFNGAAVGKAYACSL